MIKIIMCSLLNYFHGYGHLAICFLFVYLLLCIILLLLLIFYSFPSFFFIPACWRERSFLLSFGFLESHVAYLGLVGYFLGIRSILGVVSVIWGRDGYLRP